MNYKINHVVERFPPLQSLVGRWILGGASYSSPQKSERYILCDYAFQDGEGNIYTARDIARKWVKDNYKLERLRRKKTIRKPSPLPLLSTEYEGEGWYIDIKSAHKHIIESAGYDVEYELLRYLSSNPVVVPPHKTIYVSLSSLSIKPIVNLTVLLNGRIFTQKIVNHYANTSLYFLIRDVLWGIYSDIADKCGLTLVYYNTDGCIVNHPLSIDTVLDVANDWGFEARVKKEGYVRVRGVGNYAFNDEKLPHINRSRHSLTITMPYEERFWLRNRMIWANNQLETMGRYTRYDWYSSLIPASTKLPVSIGTKNTL
jgi:hypothetical protein